MVRFSLLGFLALAFSGVALAAPLEIPAVGDVCARADLPYTVCNGAPDDQIISVSIDPDSRKVGKNVILNVKVNVKNTIKAGYVDVGVKGPSSTDMRWTRGHQLCGTTACPIQRGEREFDFSVTSPEDAGPGNYTVLAFGMDENRKSFFCFYVDAFYLTPS